MKKRGLQSETEGTHTQVTTWPKKIHLPALSPHSLSDLTGCLDSTNKSPLPGYSSPSYLILVNPKHSPKLIWLRLEADPSVKSSIFAFMFSPMWVVKMQHFSLMFQEPQKIKGAASSQPTTEFTVYSAAHNTSASILSGSRKRYKLGPYNYPCREAYQGECRHNSYNNGNTNSHLYLEPGMPRAFKHPHP